MEPKEILFIATITLFHHFTVLTELRFIGRCKAICSFYLPAGLGFVNRYRGIF
jgi:hypothetical protein